MTPGDVAGLDWNTLITGITGAVVALLGAWGKAVYSRGKSKQETENHLQGLYDGLLEADRLFREEIRGELTIVKQEKLDMEIRHEEEIAKLGEKFSSLEARYDELLQRHTNQLIINERLLEEKVDWMNRALTAEAHLVGKEKDDSGRQN